MYWVKGQICNGESKGKAVFLVFRKDYTQPEGSHGGAVELVGQDFCHTQGCVLVKSAKQRGGSLISI